MKSGSCSVIVWVRVVLKRTVVGDSDGRFDNLSRSHHHHLFLRVFKNFMYSDSDDDFRLGCRNVSHCHTQQSFSGLPSPGRSHCHSRVQTLYCRMKSGLFDFITTLR